MLELKTYWINEMEYDHFLYFNDSGLKQLTQSDRSGSGLSKINLYSIRSSTLSSGTFSLFSILPDLRNYKAPENINPVDDEFLNITIYPGKDLEEIKNTTLYPNRNTVQIVTFTSINAGAFDEIILKKTDNPKYERRVSKTNGECFRDNKYYFQM